MICINNASEKGLGADDIAMLSAGLFAEVQWHRRAIISPEARKAAFRHGWFFTGDLGYFDRLLFVSGRKKDMVKVCSSPAVTLTMPGC